MKVGELRALVNSDTILWLETAEEEILEVGEADSLSHKNDDYDIGRMFVQHYPVLHAHGITVQL